MDSIPYSEVRASLADTLRRVQARDEAVFISRRGQPAGVLMSVARFQRLTGTPTGFIAAMSAWRERYAGELAEEEGAGAAADPFADVRDRRPVPVPTWTDDLAAEAGP